MPWRPEGYQKRVLKFGVERACAGFLLDPGLGKTSITLALFKLLKNAGLVRGMLVIGPLRPVSTTWPEEVEKWEDFADLKVSLMHGSPAQRLAALRAKADIYLINPEGLRWLFWALGPNKDKWPFDMLAVDESTKFKNSTSIRFQTLKPHLKRFRRRYILTGSPAPNGLQDLFGQIYVLDMGASLGQYISHYRTMHFDAGGHEGMQYTVREGHEDKIYRKVAKLVVRMSAEEYLKLPPLIPRNEYVVLPPPARKLYDELEAKFFYDLGKQSTITAVNSGALSSKMRQIANGNVYDDNKMGQWVHDAKVEALMDLLEQLQGQPTLVAYDFRHELKHLQAMLKKHGHGDVPHIGGGVSVKAARVLQDGWNRGEVPIILGHPDSVAHGLNLQKTGRALIWFSMTWNLELYEQYIRRLWRKGQTQRVFVYHIMARNTIDEIMRGRVEEKHRDQQALLRALQKYGKARGHKLPPGLELRRAA